MSLLTRSSAYFARHEKMFYARASDSEMMLFMPRAAFTSHVTLRVMRRYAALMLLSAMLQLSRAAAMPGSVLRARRFRAARASAAFIFRLPAFAILPRRH